MKQQLQQFWQIRFIHVTRIWGRYRYTSFLYNEYLILISFIKFSWSNFLVDLRIRQFYIFAQSLNNFKLEYIYEYVLIQRQKIRKLSRIEKAV